MQDKKWKDYCLLHGALFIYSTGNVFSKLAAESALLSYGFLLYYGAMLLTLVIYAVLWQQILKKFSLTEAFANKAIVIIWGIIWGALLFHEKISWRMIPGAFIIMIGVIVVVTDRE